MINEFFNQYLISDNLSIFEVDNLVNVLTVFKYSKMASDEYH